MTADPTALPLVLGGAAVLIGCVVVVGRWAVAGIVGVVRATGRVGRGEGGRAAD